MMEVKRLLGLATQWLLARVLRYDFFGWILLPLAH